MVRDAVVRRARPADRDAVVRLLRELVGFHEAFGGQDFRLAPGAEEEWKAYIQEHLTKDDRLCLVSEAEGRTVGFLLGEIRQRPGVFMEREYGYISDVFVQEPYRRRGAGKALVEGALKWFEGKRVSRVRLRTDARNALAAGFWERMGFHTTVLTMDRLL